MGCPLGQAEEEDRGQMGSTRTEEQKLTAKLVALKIKKKDAIGKRRRWRGGEGREMREGQYETKSEEEFRDKKGEGKENTVRRELVEK